MVDELSVEHISVSYDGSPAISDVTFRVAPGEVLAVTGSSGAGKSTLLWVISGALRSPTTRVDGTVRAGARMIVTHKDAVAAGVGLMPQGNGLALGLTALENVVLPLLAHGRSGRDARLSAFDALERVGLDDSADHLIEELSGGQQQRVAVARLVAARGAVVLADEPTSDLDAVNRAIVMELLRECAMLGSAVVVSTHDPEAAAAADTELHLDEGKANWARRSPAP